MGSKAITFLGAKEVGHRCLEALLESCPKLNAEVVAVAHNANTKMASDRHDIGRLCQTNGLPTIGSLDQLPECDFIISVQYNRILKPRHIAKARVLAANLHMAPLPEYRGCNQFSFALADQAETFGTTIHRLAPAVDAGDILFEERFPIPPKCRVADLYRTTLEASVRLFAQSLPSLLSGRYTPVAQADLVAERGTSHHYRHEIGQLKQIDLDWEVEKIARLVRATYFPPYEPPYAIINGKKVHLIPDGEGYRFVEWP